MTAARCAISSSTPRARRGGNPCGCVNWRRGCCARSTALTTVKARAGARAGHGDLCHGIHGEEPQLGQEGSWAFLARMHRKTRGGEAAVAMPEGGTLEREELLLGFRWDGQRGRACRQRCAGHTMERRKARWRVGESRGRPELALARGPGRQRPELEWVPALRSSDWSRREGAQGEEPRTDMEGSRELCLSSAFSRQRGQSSHAPALGENGGQVGLPRGKLELAGGNAAGARAGHGDLLLGKSRARAERVVARC